MSAIRFGVLLVMMVAGGTTCLAGKSAAADPGQARVSKGKTLYLRHCAGCHGTGGKGDGYKLLGADPANLTSPSIQKRSDSVLLKAIHEGKPNMPSWNLRLSEQDSRDVLAHIRTLAQ
jgi:mono/diheme cytochrome c family protein